jgi:hypothetical protein
MLTGSVPGGQRRQLMERFRDDPACRAFLSTDADGTGLNLQAADTLINLDVPWNPAVLEQRVARVHRLGQHRPVQVINLVTRDSIEERVLKTIDVKRSLFEGVFSGTSDEIEFGSLGHRSFLDAVRGLIVPEEPPTPVPMLVPVPDQQPQLVTLGVQFLEALVDALAGATATVTTDPRTGQRVLQIPLPPPEVLERGAAALRKLAQQQPPS